MQGKEVEALCDTQQASRSMLCQGCGSKLTAGGGNVEGLLGAGEEFNLETMNGTDIPFDGWIEVRFKLAGDVTNADELTVRTVPILVGRKEQEYLIVGFKSSVNKVKIPKLQVTSFSSHSIFSSPHSSRCSGQSYPAKITGYRYFSRQSREERCYGAKRRGNES